MTLIIGERGPCQVKFGGIDLGYTKGGVKFAGEEFTSEVTYDQTGKTPQNIIFDGSKQTIDVPLANVDLSLLEDLIAGAEIDADGMVVSAVAGMSGRARAKELMLTVYENGVPSTDPKKTIILFKAVPVSKIDWGFDNDNDRITSILFTALPDDASGNVGKLYRIGNPA
jgi:hypothetical protein